MILANEKEILQAINLSSEEISKINRAYYATLPKAKRLFFENPFISIPALFLPSFIAVVVGDMMASSVAWIGGFALFGITSFFVILPLWLNKDELVQKLIWQKISDNLNKFSLLNIHNVLTSRFTSLNEEEIKSLQRFLKENSFDMDKINLQSLESDSSFSSSPVINNKLRDSNDY